MPCPQRARPAALRNPKLRPHPAHAGLAKSPGPASLRRMLVIRRMDDGKRSYTAMFLPGEKPRVFPTTDREHARILQIYKQDKPYPDVLNDFTDYAIGADTLPGPKEASRPSPRRQRAKR